jgi:hypothetical protein
LTARADRQIDIKIGRPDTTLRIEGNQVIGHQQPTEGPGVPIACVQDALDRLDD